MPSDTLVTALTTDSAGNIYVAVQLSAGGGAVDIYAAGASGTAVPVRTLLTASGHPATAMAVDQGGSLYTLEGLEGSEIFVYPITASGAAAPLRTITGSLTDLTGAYAIAVDTSGTLYVADTWSGGSQILAFSPTASGNATPARAIAIDSPVRFYGITTDTSGNLYATIVDPRDAWISSIAEYAPDANGAATPVRTIAGSATGLDQAIAGGICVDAVGNIYVSVYTYEGYGSNPEWINNLEEFVPSATGNVSPVASFTPMNWDNYQENFDFAIW
jgi:hypothetical protein